MRSLKQFALIAVGVVLLCPAASRAQEKTPETPAVHFKLTYRLLQVGAEGKVTNSRTYSAMIGTGSESEVSMIRTGDQIPVPTSAGSPQYNYQNVGTSIDTSNPSIHDRQLSLRISVESSSVLEATHTGPAIGPIIRRASWKSNVVVALDKPTIILISDNVSDTGKTEVELTATQIKQP